MPPHPAAPPPPAAAAAPLLSPSPASASSVLLANRPQPPPPTSIFFFLSLALVVLSSFSLFGSCAACNFEDTCNWGWNASRIVTGQEVNNSWVPGDSPLQGPFADVENNTHGHFLFTYLKKPGPREIHVWSKKKYGRPSEGCRLFFWYHMHNMSDGHIRVIIATNNTQSIVSERIGNDDKRWQNYSVNIGGIKQEFSIILEFVPGLKYPLHIALDNIVLNNCFPDPPQNVCQPSQFQCSDGTCIDSTLVCNINRDCEEGEDELRDECEEVPDFARCTFEDGWCGWHNGHGTQAMNWTLNNASNPTPSMGPTADHTYGNSSGMYVFVEMTGTSHSMGSAALLESPIIYPPPKYHSNISSLYYNSCYVSFFYHKGTHSGSLGVFLIELQENANRSTKIWWSYGDKGNKWLRNYVTLPNITNRYYLQFEARKSFAAKGDPAIDDISISPKCFGIGVPKEHLDGYDYNNPFPSLEPTPEPATHVDFVNSSFYKFTTCGTSGKQGPSPAKCTAAYSGTAVNVTVLTQKTMAGIQQWIVPESGYYTMIAKGASGGKGSDGMGVSWGAMARTVMELRKGTRVFILVGQVGNPACLKTFSSNKKTVCQAPNNSKKPLKEKLKEISDLMFLPEGGGGGGGTFIFVWESGEKKPLLVAGGGGGLAHKSPHSMLHEPDSAIQHGKMMNGTLHPTTGEQYGLLSGGAGGGWRRANYTHSDATGLALTQGGVGGTACYVSNDGSDKGAGGFGGGGGGCTAGGGGGGYTGGRAWSQKGAFGEGGYSWIATGMMQKVRVPGITGPGEVYIIPATQGCSCEFRCVALDVYRSKVLCICPEGWHLSNDSTSCLINNSHRHENSIYLIAAIILGAMFLGATFLFCAYLYNRYIKKKDDKVRRQMMTGPDLQLNRLRVASDSMMTEYNPNYEFGGGVYSLRDLKEIPREHLRLVKALGQGAFGEVYQGFFKNRAGDAVEMPVAVKTLPELSTSQAETDFLMEALIMSKFNHPNIVHFIGVCFDKHPRFIVIELLAGGDLKTFLREARPKPDRASPLTMKDLITCVVDVAKGCKYLEEHRFIHRDIAARNCLLTTKGPGRVVKIADFGMARDIYRADYYKKGGKAMLPIKWMPPEAFLDGIFTAKTDVWSFGVLMWEVMSLGYMPYTGCANREVMQLVTSGGRLEPPTNCPGQLYAIMTQCWLPNPADRPNFSLILERLGYCLQDPDVTKAPLPVYAKAPSSERDETIMRPAGGEDCIQPDYLVPLTGGPTDWEGFNSQLPESRSTQPLLDSSSSGAGSPAATNNNNPLASSLPAKHLGQQNHLHHLPHSEQEIFLVSSALKSDNEISC